VNYGEMTKNRQIKGATELLAGLLGDFGALGGFANTEGITVSFEEVEKLAALEAEWVIKLVDEQLINLDWFDRVRKLREANKGA
jgi:hypothetical protein